MRTEKKPKKNPKKTSSEQEESKCKTPTNQGKQVSLQLFEAYQKKTNKKNVLFFQ